MHWNLSPTYFNERVLCRSTTQKAIVFGFCPLTNKNMCIKAVEINLGNLLDVPDWFLKIKLAESRYNDDNNYKYDEFANCAMVIKNEKLKIQTVKRSSIKLVLLRPYKAIRKSSLAI